MFKRLAREKRTISVMVSMYCRNRHGGHKGLCRDCLSLLHYANGRIDKCPYAEVKPQCTQCKIHCYKKDMREKVRRVMRYSGPRMVWTHPLLALLHTFDGLFFPKTA